MYQRLASGLCESDSRGQQGEFFLRIDNGALINRVKAMLTYFLTNGGVKLSRRTNAG